MERVSIVVPTFNQAKYLPICLDSIWFQEYDDLEIIVVNDGSSDNTAEVLAQYEAAIAGDTTSYASNYDAATETVERTQQQRYATAGRRLVVRTHERNRGLSEALNTGLTAVTAPLCTFIASDDMLLPGMIRELRAALYAKNADFAYADMHIVDDTGRIVRKFVLPDYTFPACFCHWYFCGIAKLYKYELHQRFGLYDPAYTVQDHELFLRFAMGGATFTHVPRVLANVRDHGSGRKVDNHSQDGMRRLYRESAQLVATARAFWSEKSGRPTRD